MQKSYKYYVLLNSSRNFRFWKHTTVTCALIAHSLLVYYREFVKTIYLILQYGKKLWNFSNFCNLLSYISKNSKVNDKIQFRNEKISHKSIKPENQENFTMLPAPIKSLNDVFQTFISENTVCKNT